VRFVAERRVFGMIDVFVPRGAMNSTCVALISLMVNGCGINVIVVRVVVVLRVDVVVVIFARVVVFVRVVDVDVVAVRVVFCRKDVVVDANVVMFARVVDVEGRKDVVCVVFCAMVVFARVVCCVDVVVTVMFCVIVVVVGVIDVVTVVFSRVVDVGGGRGVFCVVEEDVVVFARVVGCVDVVVTVVFCVDVVVKEAEVCVDVVTVVLNAG